MLSVVTTVTSALEPLNASKSYFPEITGLRAVAAYLVFIHHLQPELTFLPEGIRTILMADNSGLNAFFVMSSFLIFYRYGNRTSSTPSSYYAYLATRLARIYPLYFVLTLITLLWQKDYDGWHWFLNFTLSKGYFVTEKFTGIAPGWSLSVQESFYLAAPILYTAFFMFPVRTILLTSATGVMLILLSKLFHFSSFIPTAEHLLTFTPFGYIMSFYAGFLLARHLSRVQRLSNREQGLVTYIGLGLTVICLCLVYSYGDLLLPIPGSVSVKLLLINVIFPFCFIIFLSGLLSTQTSISRLLAARPVQLLGRGSYAFYLLHTGLFYEAIYFHVSKNLLIIFLVLNIISIFTYYFFEQPIYLILRKHFRSSKKILSTT